MAALGLGYSSWSSTGKLGGMLDTAVTKTAKKLELCAHLGKTLSDMGSIERGTVVRVAIKDAAKIEQYKQQFDQKAGQADNDLKELRPLLVTEAGRQADENIQASLAAWQGAHRQFLEASKTSKNVSSLAGFFVDKVVPIEATATDLDLRPLKGKVEGKNTGKNVLVRSLSGIGQVGAMLLGQGSLNQPLSESDLMRERVSNNVGEAGDEEVSLLSITQHIVVTISADTPIYVVLEQTPKASQGPLQPSGRAVPTSNSANVEQLRQLLQLQQELNQSSASNQPAQ